MTKRNVAATSARDPFLDFVRAFAVVRVVAWHTFGWAPITWVVSAVPAMVFVSGHLLATSRERRTFALVLPDRLRRLLLPYWVFALGAWVAMGAARLWRDRPDTALDWHDVPGWVLQSTTLGDRTGRAVG